MRIKTFLIVFLLLIASQAQAATYTVCSSGCDYTTVQAGVNAASAGDTVSITDGGTYNENVTTARHGTDGAYITIAGTGTPTIKQLTISHNYNKITGIKFRGNTTRYSALVTFNGSYSWVENCILEGDGTLEVGGVYFLGSHNTFKANTVRYISYKHVDSRTNTVGNIIEGNTFTENISGGDIFYLFGDGQIIKDNTLKNITDYGVFWDNAETLVVGQGRRSASATSASCNNGANQCYWLVTTAGTTGATEPEGFNFASTAAIGSTLNDNTVVWTLRQHNGQHPDLFQTFNNPGANNISKNHIIDGNICVENCNMTNDYLQLGNIEQKHSVDIKDWTFRNNIFRLARTFNIIAPGFKFYNNVFLGPMSQNAASLSLGCSITHGCANNTIIKNNAVIGTYDSSEIALLYPNYTSIAQKPTARQNSTAYTLNQRIYTATPDGYHIWKCTTAGTTAESEPAGYAVNKSITANTTAGSATLSNVSSFTGFTADHTGTAPHYFLVDWNNHLNYMSHIDAISEGTSTITSSVAAISSATGTAISVVPDCGQKTITVTDGGAVFTCQNGYYGLDADYNMVAKGPETYGSKTGFAGAETHGVNGGDPKFTSYTGTTKASFAIAEGSALIDKGVDLSSVWTSPLDTAGTPRSGTWDIGAYQYGGTADTTPPTITSATINVGGDTLTLVFDEVVTVNTSTGFTLGMSGGAAGLTYTSGSGTNTIVYAITGRNIDTAETGTLDYVTVANGIEDASGNDLASTGETDVAVTNNSTYSPSATTYIVTVQSSGDCTVSPLTNQVIVSGETASYTCAANGNSGCAAWTGTCGGTGTTSFTSSAVTGNCTVIQGCYKISPDIAIGSGAAVTLGSGAVGTLY